MKVLCVLLNNPQKRQTIAEAGLQWTPQVALGQDCVFLEITQSLNLFSEREILKKLTELLDSMGILATLSMGKSPGWALSCAKTGLPPDDLPIETLEYFLSPFNPGNQLSLALKHLRQLGLYQLKDLKKIPPSSLALRWGPSLLRAYQHAFEDRPILWPPFQPQRKIMEHIILDHPVFTLEPLLFLLRPLLEQILIYLRSQGLSVLKFCLRLELEGHLNTPKATRAWDFSFHSALNQIQFIWPILYERLNWDLQRKPLERAITACAIEVQETLPTIAQQKNFFSKKEEEQEGLDSLIIRLNEKLGPQKAFRASGVENYLPELGWEKSFKFKEIKIPALPLRPLILFYSPRRIYKIKNEFVHGLQRYKIFKLEETEILSGQWWRDGGYKRHYFIATLEDHSQWWVYQNSNSKELYFWHGVFD